MTKARRELPAYEFLTAFPQIASRLGHKTETVRTVIIAIMAKVVSTYPQRALWPMVYLMQSNRPERKRLCAQVTALTQVRAEGNRLM
jgi:serine/threonine-protein kinase ATR